ncbi:hypothetical protein SAMN05421665_3550 [Yoonia rosea]|uniref:Uncharacterized protein n=1 Tax=Yoonia rosea TaxID=287098 RepID=A0A1R3XKI0_9RHOB|nr:hypothetical protein SAMN05421665_3550 [Yoonia rosea]
MKIAPLLCAGLISINTKVPDEERGPCRRRHADMKLPFAGRRSGALYQPDKEQENDGAKCGVDDTSDQTAT